MVLAEQAERQGTADPTRNLVVVAMLLAAAVRAAPANR
jgi:hypothetical protein